MRAGPPPPHPDRSSGRSAAVRRVLWITLLLNLAVALAKLGVGWSTHTLSMIADGYHSLLDGAGNVLGLVALIVAHRPPDSEHHYGHRKFEVVASIGISLMLFVAAAEILLAAWSRLSGGTEPGVFSNVSVVVIVITMAVNLGVSRYEARRGRQLHSPFLVADSRHTASDVYASASVLLALAGLKLGVTWIDPLAAVIIGGVIVRAGYAILSWSLGVLADRALIEATTIEAIALEFPHVRSCHQIRTRGFADAVFVDLTVRFEPTLSLRQAHEVCDAIEERLRREYPEIDDIVLHMEPDESAPDETR